MFFPSFTYLIPAHCCRTPRAVPVIFLLLPTPFLLCCSCCFVFDNASMVTSFCIVSPIRLSYFPLSFGFSLAIKLRLLMHEDARRRLRVFACSASRNLQYSIPYHTTLQTRHLLRACRPCPCEHVVFCARVVLCVLVISRKLGLLSLTSLPSFAGLLSCASLLYLQIFCMLRFLLTQCFFQRLVFSTALSFPTSLGRNTQNT